MQFFTQNLLAGTPGHTSHTNKFINCSVMVLQHKLMNFCDVFICFGDWQLPWMRLVFKQQRTILKAWKPLTDLCFACGSVLLSYLEHDHCFGCCFPQQKTESHGSMPFLRFDYQKNQQTGERHCKPKTYHMAIWSQWTMLVSRLMLEGCTKWWKPELQWACPRENVSDYCVGTPLYIFS